MVFLGVGGLIFTTQRKVFTLPAVRIPYQGKVQIGNLQQRTPLWLPVGKTW